LDQSAENSAFEKKDELRTADLKPGSVKDDAAKERQG